VFLGQLRSDETADLSLVAELAGEYPAVLDYKGNAAWTGVTIADTGAITFTGGAGPSVAVGDVTAVYDRLACCGRIGVEVDFDLDGDEESTDELQLYTDAEGNLASIEYLTGGNIRDVIGVRVASLTLPTHDETPVPETHSIAASAVIEGGDTVALDMPIMEGSYANNSFHTIGISGEVVNDSSQLQQRINLRVEATGALTAGQSFDCNYYGDGTHTTRLSVKTSAPFTADYDTENAGACRITLTTVTPDGEDPGAFTLIEGTFTAELYNNKRDSKVTIDDGVFRWMPPQ
jgi:hypothetical protein